MAQEQNGISNSIYEWAKQHIWLTETIPPSNSENLKPLTPRLISEAPETKLPPPQEQYVYKATGGKKSTTPTKSTTQTANAAITLKSSGIKPPTPRGAISEASGISSAPKKTVVVKKTAGPPTLSNFKKDVKGETTENKDIVDKLDLINKNVDQKFKDVKNKIDMVGKDQNENFDLLKNNVEELSNEIYESLPPVLDVLVEFDKKQANMLAKLDNVNEGVTNLQTDISKKIQGVEDQLERVHAEQKSEIENIKFELNAVCNQNKELIGQQNEMLETLKQQTNYIVNLVGVVERQQKTIEELTQNLRILHQPLPALMNDKLIRPTNNLSKNGARFKFNENAPTNSNAAQAESSISLCNNHS